MTRPVEPPSNGAGARSSCQAGEGLRRAATDLDQGRDGALARVWDLVADELYGLALWRTGSSEDAEDVVQEVFVRLARSPERLARARDPRAYLMRMAHNAAVDVIRRRRPEAPLEAAAVFAIVESGAEAAVDAARACRHLAELPDTQREALFLRHFAGLSFREIGSATGVPTFTAATRCRLAIGRLRTAMGVES